MSNPARPLNENAKKVEVFPSSTLPDYLSRLIERGNGKATVELLSSGSMVEKLAVDGEKAAAEVLLHLRTGTKSVESMKEALDKLDMDLMRSFVIPMSLTVAPYYFHAEGRLARAAEGHAGFDMRVRSKYAYALAHAVWKELPSGDRIDVREKVEKTVAAEGHPQHTLGRLLQYYPRVGAVAPVKPPHPVEVELALNHCGLRVLSNIQQLATLRLAEEALELPGFDVVKVNPKASNGFPVLGRWSDPEARQKVLGLAMSLAPLIEEAHQKDNRGGVATLVRTWHRTRPEIVAVVGKCKGDYYPLDKVIAQKMRFYNVLPRHLMLLMQQATQVLEARARNAFTHREHVETLPPDLRTVVTRENHTAQGTYLNKGGAARLVQALDTQLDEYVARAAAARLKEPRLSPVNGSFAFLHAGDDSWVVVRDGERVVCFALDCSSFDLTQHSAVTAPIHAAVRGELAKLSRHESLLADNLSGGAAAALWHIFMRERLTVVAGTLTRLVKHGGPSGAPLQSKVNDLLMDVMLQRLRAAVVSLETGWTRQANAEGRLNALIARTGHGLGLVVRVEQYGYADVATTAEYLLHHEFTFLGYKFHNRLEPVEVGVRNGVPILHTPGVVAYVDLPRNMAQLPYPNTKWTKHGGELRMTEAMRLGSIAANLGVPPARLDRAFDAYRREAYLQLRAMNTLLAAGGRGEEDEPRDALRWALSDNPLVGLVSPSLRGLEDYLYQRRFFQSWMPGCRDGGVPGVPPYALVSPEGKATSPLSWDEIPEAGRALAAATVPEERISIMRYTIDQLKALRPPLPVAPLAIAATMHLQVRAPAFAVAPTPGLLVRAPNGKETVVPSVVTVRPATAANDGRPPPTATLTRAEKRAQKASRPGDGGRRTAQDKRYASTEKMEEEGRDTRQSAKRRARKGRK